MNRSIHEPVSIRQKALKYHKNLLVGTNQRQNVLVPMVEKIKTFEAPNLVDGHDPEELALQRYSIFTLQNTEKGHFDVTFLFGTKQLHAHSFILWTASEVFEAMIFGAWAKKEPIPITSHSFEDFKEFLTFFYLGKCNINMENVMALVDLSESYNVKLLKDSCDQYLTDITPTSENAFQLCETLKIYSLKNALDNLYEFIAINASTLLKSKSFLETTKEIVLDIVKMERLIVKEEDLFDAIYKWVEYQYKKQEKKEPIWIKEELADILPYIRFAIMDIEFLHNRVVPLGNLFSSFSELSLILRDADAFQKKQLTRLSSKYPHTVRKGFNVQIIHGRNIAHTYFSDMQIIQKLTNIGQNYSYLNNNCYNYYNNSYGNGECYWNIEIPKPAAKNSLFDLNACKFYLIRNAQGLLALRNFGTETTNLALMDNRNRGLVHQQQNTNRIAQLRLMVNNNVQNDSLDYDIIARVYPENDNFNVGQGCILKVIPENL